MTNFSPYEWLQLEIKRGSKKRLEPANRKDTWKANWELHWCVNDAAAGCPEDQKRRKGRRMHQGRNKLHFGREIQRKVFD